MVWEVSRRQALERGQRMNMQGCAMHTDQRCIAPPRAVQYSAAAAAGGIGEGLPYLGQDKNPGL